MRERGMIFNADMVRAIIDGRKSQTRRIIKNQPDEDGLAKLVDGPWVDTSERLYHCPFGQLGDRLWVREAFATLGNEDGCAIDWKGNLIKSGGPEAARIYRASCEQASGNYGLWSIPDDAFWKPHTENMLYEGGWVPSARMSRWASRITLEITGVRVERLQHAEENSLLDEIGDMLEDCNSVAGRAFNHAEHYAIAGVPVGMSPEMHGFKAWWDKANGYGSFDSNPWVWVIEFRRVEVNS